MSLILDFNGHVLANIEIALNSLVSNSERRRTVIVNSEIAFEVRDSVGTDIFDNVSYGRGTIVNYGGTVTHGRNHHQVRQERHQRGTEPEYVSDGSNLWYVIDNQGIMTINSGTVVNIEYFSLFIRNLGIIYDVKFIINGGMF